ncbi:MAG: CHAT domain-containing protein [bacterium]|nr:CHAT domain-containing protein [bacterium]
MPSSTELLSKIGRVALIGALVFGTGCLGGTDDSAPTGPPTDSPRQEPASAEPRDLELGQQLEGSLAPAEIHTFRLLSEADQFLHVVVDQQDVDVVATLTGPSENEMLLMDRSIGAIGPEPLMAITGAGGIHTVKVEAAAGDRPVGSYEIWVEESRPATDSDRLRADAISLFADARALYKQREFRSATERFSEARKAWQSLEKERWEAESLLRMGLAYARLKKWQEAASCHEEANRLFEAAGTPRWQAIALHQLGLDYLYLGDLDQAIDRYRQALPLRRQAEDLRGEALTHHELALAFQRQDEVQQALDSYSRALELFQRAGDRGQTTHNLGVLYLSLGRTDHARDALEEALEAWAEIGDRRRQATTLNQLGELYRGLGDLNRALDHYRRALALRRELEDQRGEITSLANIGLVYQALSQPTKAREHYLEAQSLLVDLQRPRLEARVLLNLGSLQTSEGQIEEARKSYRKSLDLYRSVGDPTGGAEALVGVARAESYDGNLMAALEASGDALSIFETVRPRAVSPELRTSFFATVQDHFEFHIDLLMELHRREPEADYNARALMVSERARARSLLDLLAEAGGKIRREADPALLERERELQQQLNARERERFELRRVPRVRSQALAAVEKDVRLALQRLEAVRGEIRARHPRYAALTQPLSLKEIQELVLDRSALLLEYQLGTERSFLWAVTPDSIQSYELPGRAEIESLARRTYTLLTNSHRREARESTQNALCELSKQLLRPVATSMAGQRLLIVADGALQFIPFAALPGPRSLDQCAEAQPLVVEHEITHLPSASALAVLRREIKRREPAAHSVAVVADPVFATANGRLRDPRMPVVEAPDARAIGSSEDFTSSLPTGDVDPRFFERLPYSRREAAVILGLVDEEQRFSALGFDANKETVLRGRLSGYRVVHFATHGVLNTRHPELSAIVLSQVDRAGLERDGFLRAHEIYNLELPCELVVLSACQTALGKVVRGEGLLSLTRGFMYAGAERVMVSLWNVSDASTAELMERFYRGLFEQDLRPAAALRAAQIAMWQSETRSAYYYWAGFVIQGEWQ